MNAIIQQFFDSPLMMALAGVLFFSSSITTFDIRIIQAKGSGALPPDHPNLPLWVFLFHVLDYSILIVLVAVNWRVGLAVWACRFALKFLPVLETVGNVLTAPFRKR
jgi:hypothetical protein